jgi:O-antigen ligase
VTTKLAVQRNNARLLIVSIGASLCLTTAMVALTYALGPKQSMLIAAVAIVAIGGIFSRRIFRTVRDHGSRLAATRELDYEARSGDRDRSYLTARIFYYLGMLTIAETLLRVGGFSISDWIFLVGLVAFLAEFLIRGDPPLLLPPWMLLGLVLLCVGGVLSSPTAKDPVDSYLEVAKYIYLLAIWLWLGTMVLTRPAHVYVALCCWLCSSAVSGLGALAAIYFGLAVKSATFAGRAKGLTEHMNELGMVGAMALVPSIILALSAQGLLMRTLGAVCAIAVLCALVLSESFSALIAAVVVMLLWAVSLLDLKRLRVGPSAFLAVFCVLGIVRALTLQGTQGMPTVFDRLARFQERSGANRTLGFRIATIAEAWDSIAKDPFIGVGLDQESAQTPSGEFVHDYPLSQWYEGGALSFIGILIIMSCIVFMDVEIIRQANSFLEWWLGVACLMCFCSFFIYALASPIEHHRDAWAFAAFPLALDAVRRRARTENRDVSESYL